MHTLLADERAERVVSFAIPADQPTSMERGEVGTVVLFGGPGEALQHYAAANGYELIVAASHSLRRSPLGWRAAAGDLSVPVLVGPGVA